MILRADWGEMGSVDEQMFGAKVGSGNGSGPGDGI